MKVIQFIFAVTVGFFVFYFAPLSSIVMQYITWEGKMTVQEGVNILKDKGYNAMYGWYQVKEFRPTVVVAVKKDDKTLKIPVDMLNGRILDEDNKLGRSQSDQPAVVEADTVDTTAPTVSITYPANNAELPAGTTGVEVKAQVSDDQDPNPTVTGAGWQSLTQGWNSIVVSATDAAGNVGTDYIIVYRP